MFFVYRKARLLFIENSSSLSSESILLCYSRKNNSQVSTTKAPFVSFYFEELESY
jgi:hypothetical protein